MDKRQKSDTDQRQFWQMVVETFKSSGLSVRKFCEKEGLQEASFYSWRKRLTADKKTENTKAESGQTEPFIQVAMPPANSTSMELTLLSGNSLKINSGTDRRTLIDVITVLQQAGLC